MRLGWGFGFRVGAFWDGVGDSVVSWWLWWVVVWWVSWFGCGGWWFWWTDCIS